MKKIVISSTLLFCHLSASADSALTLTPLTVTATRSPITSKAVSTTLIQREDIERLQLQTVEAALSAVAGINISNNGGVGKNTSVFMRGTEADHVLVLIDGIRVGSATSGTAAWQNLPISEIESIEVIRGSKSSLYGADAIGGVIHIHTRNARTATTSIAPVLSAGGGTYGHYKVAAGVSGKVDKAWYNFNMSHEQTEGFNTCQGALDHGCFTNEPDRDGYENHAGSLRLGYDFEDWLSLEGHLLYSGGSSDFDGSFVNEGEFTQLIYGATAKIKATDYWHIDLSAGESRDESTNFLNGTQRSIFDTQRFSFAAINHLSISDQHLVSVGYDFLDDRVNSDTMFADTSRNNHALFVQYQGHWLQNQFTLAYREDFNEQFGNNGTWNAAWAYVFKNGLAVSASYGTAFKAPTFNELYFPDFGNSDLRPESSETYELGVAGDHELWRWSLNAYLTYIDDMIAYDSTLFAPNNLSKARIMGLEAIVATQFYDFDLQINYSALNPESRDSRTSGNILARRAQQVFRVDIDRVVGDFNFGSSVRVEGRRFDDLNNTRRLAGFAAWDLRAAYQLQDTLNLQVSVKNLLNKQYQTAAGYYTEGTTVFFNLRYTPKF